MLISVYLLHLLIKLTLFRINYYFKRILSNESFGIIIRLFPIYTNAKIHQLPIGSVLSEVELGRENPVNPVFDPPQQQLGGDCKLSTQNSPQVRIN